MVGEVITMHLCVMMTPVGHVHMTNQDINIFVFSINFMKKKGVLVISTLRFFMICVQPVWTKGESEAQS